jgi:hypothetical protein
MAAEVARHGGEDAARAAAAIIAAQLSTLVGPPVSRATDLSVTADASLP